MGSTRTAQTAGALGLSAGASTAVVLWLAIVPWDLSEIDKTGRSIPNGGDDNAPAVALVFGLIAALGFIAAWAQRTRPHAVAFTGAASASWALLLGWRAGVARVIGANMFVIPLMLASVGAALLTVLVHLVATRNPEPRPWF